MEVHGPWQQENKQKRCQQTSLLSKHFILSSDQKWAHTKSQSDVTLESLFVCKTGTLLKWNHGVSAESDCRSLQRSWGSPFLMNTRLHPSPTVSLVPLCCWSCVFLSWFQFSLSKVCTVKVSEMISCLQHWSRTDDELQHLVTMSDESLG